MLDPQKRTKFLSALSKRPSGMHYVALLGMIVIFGPTKNSTTTVGIVAALLSIVILFAPKPAMNRAFWISIWLLFATLAVPYDVAIRRSGTFGAKFVPVVLNHQAENLVTAAAHEKGLEENRDFICYGTPFSLLAPQNALVIFVPGEDSKSTGQSE
jgi:hypothetical protein